MTDLIRLATELERSGGQHRFAALMHAAISVLLRHERGEKRLSLSDLNLSCTARTVFIEIGDGLVIQLPADEARVLGDFLKEALGENESGVGMSDKAVLVRGERWPLPAVDGAPDADVTVRGTTEGVEARGHKSNDLQTTRMMEYYAGLASRKQDKCDAFDFRGATPLTDCQDDRPTGGITHADGSPLMPRRMVPRFAAPIEEDGE